jgi:hypothetical protein
MTGKDMIVMSKREARRLHVVQQVARGPKSLIAASRANTVCW